MRLQCEFGDCQCSLCLGTGRCRRCGHGECWHKRSTQFDSQRVSAHRGRYIRIPIITGVFSPQVPPTSPTEDPTDFCVTVIGLPV